MKAWRAELDPALRTWGLLAGLMKGVTAENLRRTRRLASLGKQRVVKGVTTSNVDHGRLFVPTGAASPRPALLWIHGGGYVMGRPEMEDGYASRIARDLDIAVLSVRYRLAPEHRAPAQLEDCHAALVWLSEHGGVDASRIAVGGNSAGGGLAAALAQFAQDRNEVSVAFQLLVYPMLDDRTCLREELTARRVLMWNNHSNRFGWGSYLGIEAGSADASAPAVPARRADLSGLPPAWVGVGGVDLFHDECVEYARRLGEAGVKCELVVAPGAFHAFDRIAARTPVARSFVNAQREALRVGLT